VILSWDNLSNTQHVFVRVSALRNGSSGVFCYLLSISIFLTRMSWPDWKWDLYDLINCTSILSKNIISIIHKSHLFFLEWVLKWKPIWFTIELNISWYDRHFDNNPPKPPQTKRRKVINALSTLTYICRNLSKHSCHICWIYRILQSKNDMIATLLNIQYLTIFFLRN
jgi:hypothetical protein